MDYVTLANGVKMPQLGYGVYQVTKEECKRCVLDALDVGYRAIDTAQSYFNEAEVGEAIAESGIDRKEIFLTTKVWIEHYGYEQAKESVLQSMESSKPITSTLCCCTNRLLITMELIVRWKIYTKKVSCVLSVFPTSILTDL